MCHLGIPFVACVFLVAVSGSQDAVEYVRHRRNTFVTLGAKVLDKLLKHATPLHRVTSQPRWDVSYVKGGSVTALKKDWDEIPSKLIKISAINKNGKLFEAQGKVVGDRYFSMAKPYRGYPPQMNVYRITIADETNSVVKLVEPIHIKYLSGD